MKRPIRSQRTQPDLFAALGALRQLTKNFLLSSFVQGSAAGRAANLRKRKG